MKLIEIKEYKKSGKTYLYIDGEFVGEIKKSDLNIDKELPSNKLSTLLDVQIYGESYTRQYLDCHVQHYINDELVHDYIPIAGE